MKERGNGTEMKVKGEGNANEKERGRNGNEREGGVERKRKGKRNRMQKEVRFVCKHGLDKRNRTPKPSRTTPAAKNTTLIRSHRIPQNCGGPPTSLLNADASDSLTFRNTRSAKGRENESIQVSDWESSGSDSISIATRCHSPSMMSQTEYRQDI